MAVRARRTVTGLTTINSGCLRSRWTICRCAKNHPAAMSNARPANMCSLRQVLLEFMRDEISWTDLKACPCPAGRVSSEFRFEVADGSVEGHELWIIDLRNVYTETLVDGGNKVEEVHGIDVERFAQVRRWIDRIHIDFRCNVSEFLP